MTPVAKFNFDYTSTSLGARWFRFERGGGKRIYIKNNIEFYSDLESLNR